MRIDMKQREKLLGTFIWGVFGLLLMLLTGCVTPKNTDRDAQIDYSNELQQMQNRMDSLMYNMDLVRKETSEKLSNLKIENKTVYLSPPDSTGKQYPTAISNTTAHKEEVENKTTDTKIEVAMQQLITGVNELKQQLNIAMSEKEQVKEVSWWQLHKVDVYAVLFTALIAIYFMYKMRK